MWFLPVDPVIRESAKIFVGFPEPCVKTKYFIRDASTKTLYMPGKGYVYKQHLERDGICIELLVGVFSTPVGFIVSGPEAVSVLACSLAGDISYTLDGVGESDLPKNTMRLIHSKKRALHKVVFPKGTNVILSISIDPEFLRNKGRYLMILEHFYSHIKAGGFVCFQQAAMQLTPDDFFWIDILLEHCIQKDAGDFILAMAGEHLFDSYCSRLRQYRITGYMSDGDVKRIEPRLAWIEEAALTKFIGIPEMKAKMKVSDFTLRKVFRGMMDISPCAYFMEVKLSILRRRLLDSNDSVAGIAKKLGISYDWVMEHIADRYGQRTTELRNWGGLFFPGQDAGDSRL